MQSHPRIPLISMRWGKKLRAREKDQWHVQDEASVVVEAPLAFFFPRGPKNTESYSKRRKTKPTTKSQMLKSRKKEAFRRKKRRSGEKEMVEDEIICIVGVGWVYKLDVLRMELTFSQTLCNTASLATFFSSFNNKHKQDELLRNGEFFGDKLKALMKDF